MRQEVQHAVAIGVDLAGDIGPGPLPTTVEIAIESGPAEIRLKAFAAEWFAVGGELHAHHQGGVFDDRGVAKLNVFSKGSDGDGNCALQAAEKSAAPSAGYADEDDRS